MSKHGNSTWQKERDEAALALITAKHKRQFRPKTKNQQTYLEALEQGTVVICVGPAGTGKTFMACGHAAREFKEGRIQRIVITRPNVPCGKGYGFRPGDMEQKMAPTMRPLLDAFAEFFSPSEMASLLKDKTIEVLPLDDMRGCSLPGTIIICDEAQNAEYNQLHMVLTRFGLGSKVILTGDDSKTQTDLPHTGINPLRKVIRNFLPQCNASVRIVRLGREDIVRHPLLQWIDERLTDGPPREEEWVRAKCPACLKNFLYPESQVDPEEDGIVECCHCKKKIELLDEKGRFDPIVIKRAPVFCETRPA